MVIFFKKKLTKSSDIFLSVRLLYGRINFFYIRNFLLSKKSYEKQAATGGVQ